VDGTVHELPAELGERSLLRVLRDDLNLLGPKNACEQGECGSCTVVLAGEIVCACLVPLAQAAGHEVETVASVAAPDGQLHPVQAALLAHGGVQCGFCTPGMVIAGRDLLRRIPEPSDQDIEEGLAGNLCRCTGYQKIVQAIHTAAAR
jgi:carbon-monoxide dehydrogenase small subunit